MLFQSILVYPFMSLYLRLRLLRLLQIHCHHSKVASESVKSHKVWTYGYYGSFQLL